MAREPITAEQREMAEKYLASRVRACPMCLNQKWEPITIIAPFVFQQLGPLEEFGGSSDEKTLVPLLVVACTNCLNTNFYPWKNVVQRMLGLG